MTLPFDTHTHHKRRRDAVINLAAGEQPEEGYLYSAGVHPWETAGLSLPPCARMAEVERLASLPQVVAIGETGLDRLRGGPPDMQMELLRCHAALSESTGKPLLLHVVKAYPEIIRLKRELSPSQPWIIHGFRGKPQLAAELVRAGFLLSLGERFNPDSAAVIPADRLLVETDESDLPIAEIARRIRFCRK